MKLNNKQLESCVFYSYSCNPNNPNNPKKQKIHKILPFHFFIQNELTNQSRLAHEHNIKDHFYLCENMTELKLTYLDDNNTNINTEHTKQDNNILLVFENRDLITLKMYLKNLSSLSSLSSSTKYISTIINTYKHLLHSIHLLVNNTIFHNHINFDSIVVDNLENVLLSNFSVSIHYLHTDIEQYIKHFIIAYEPSYIEWPIELHILSYLLTNKLKSLSSYNIETIINEYINHNSILYIFGEQIVSSYKEEAIQYFKKYTNHTYEWILFDMLQFANTWDNYALSILFLRILIGIHKTIGISNKFIICFMKLLVTNIHTNPTKRKNINSTIEHFDILLDNLSPNDYKNVIRRLMSA